MINLILYGALGFIGLKLAGKVGATTGSTSNARSRSSIQGASGGTAPVTVNVSPTQGPGSSSHGGAGNANQPWYNGALVAGAGLGAAAIGKGLTSLFAKSTEPDSGPTVDETDISSAEDEMGASSVSASADNEVAGDESEGDTGE